MFIVLLTGSRFFKSNHYVTLDRGSIVCQRSKARATKMTRDQAEKIATNWSDPNGFSASVVAA